MFGEKRQAFIGKEADYLAMCPVSSDQRAREVAKRAQQEYRMASVFYWAMRRAKTAKTPVYTYIFEQPIPWPQHPEFGVFHSSDLVYAFNNLKKLDRPWTDDDRHVADRVSSYWVNFVKTGNPNGEASPSGCRSIRTNRRPWHWAQDQCLGRSLPMRGWGSIASC